MAKLTPQEFQEKHARRLKGAVEDMRQGIERVTTAPGQAAAAKQEKMKQRLVEKIDDGTWAKRVAAVSLEDWKTKMIDKGLTRVASGIDAAQDKVIDFASQLLPHIDKVQSDIQRMPDLTLEDSIQRMTAFTRGMAKFRKR